MAKLADHVTGVVAGQAITIGRPLDATRVGCQGIMLVMFVPARALPGGRSEPFFIAGCTCDSAGPRRDGETVEAFTLAVADAFGHTRRVEAQLYRHPE